MLPFCQAKSYHCSPCFYCSFLMLKYVLYISPLLRILVILYLSHFVLVSRLIHRKTSEFSARRLYRQTNTSIQSSRVVHFSVSAMGNCQSWFFWGRPLRRMQAWVQPWPRQGTQQALRRNHPAGFGDLSPPAQRQQKEIPEDAGG